MEADGLTRAQGAGDAALSRALDSLDEAVASASGSAAALALSLDTGTSPNEKNGLPDPA